jgi:AcrR family transcriptional regulator
VSASPELIEKRRPPLVKGPPCVRESPRTRILDAMVSLVADRGFEATTVESIIDLAGVEQHVFDAYFAGKQDCLVQGIDQVVGLTRQVVGEAYNVPAPWPQRIRASLDAFLSALAANPEWTWLTMVESCAVGNDAMQHYRRAYASFLSLYDEGRVESAHPEAIPPHTSDVVVGGIASVVQRTVAQGEAASLRSLLPDLVYYALVPYVGHSEAMAMAANPSSAD